MAQPPTVQTWAVHKPRQDQPWWTALFRSQGGSRTQKVSAPPQHPGKPGSGHSRWGAPSQGPRDGFARASVLLPLPRMNSLSGVGLLPSRLRAWVIPAQQGSWRVSTPMVSSGPSCGSSPLVTALPPTSQQSPGSGPHMPVSAPRPESHTESPGSCEPWRREPRLMQMPPGTPWSCSSSRWHPGSNWHPRPC